MINPTPNKPHFRLYFTSLALIASFILPTLSASAQPAPARDTQAQQAVLWTFVAPNAPADAIDKIQRGLREALPDKGARHLFGEKALQDYIAHNSASPAECLLGLEPCVSPQTLAFDALGLALVIHVEITRADAQWVAQSRWVDRRGEVAGRTSLKAGSARDLAFELAGEIFDSTASVSVLSEPPGAQVEIDGDPVGTTPLTYRLSLGEHRYQLQLDHHETVTGTFTLKADTPERIVHQLQAQSGALVLLNTPPGAQLVIDGEPRGPAHHRVELPAGTYQIEVRAAGYDTHQETLVLGQGQAVERRVQMDESHPLLRDIAADAIVQNRYIARLSYDHSFQRATLQDTRATVGPAHLSFRSFRGADSSPPQNHLVSPNGLRLDFSYHWENFGLILLSASYLSSALELDALLDSSAVREPIEVRIERLRRLQLRPLQLRYRVFYKNLAVFAEAGTGINIDWIKARGELLDAPVSLSNSEAFWALGLGTSYYFTPHIFALFRYSAQAYIDDGPGAEHVLSLGAGIALPNIFGVEPEPPETLE